MPTAYKNEGFPPITDALRRIVYTVRDGRVTSNRGATWVRFGDRLRGSSAIVGSHLLSSWSSCSFLEFSCSSPSHRIRCSQTGRRKPRAYRISAHSTGQFRSTGVPEDLSRRPLPSATSRGMPPPGTSSRSVPLTKHLWFSTQQLNPSFARTTRSTNSDPKQSALAVEEEPL